MSGARTLMPAGPRFPAATEKTILIQCLSGMSEPTSGHQNLGFQGLALAKESRLPYGGHDLSEPLRHFTVVKMFERPGR